MQTWITYFVERFSPLFSLTVIVGMALTAVLIGGNVFSLVPFFVSCVTLFYVGFLLRVRNDVQDLEKDRIAFPERALPRGLLTRSSAAHTVMYLEYGLLLLFILIFIYFWRNTRLALLLFASYFWLLEKDFYCGEWLERRPFLKGLSRQSLIIFLTVLVISIGRPGMAFSEQGVAYALLTFASFFIFEICRKLDPFAHPVSMSYVHFYGFRLTYFMACFLLLISAYCSYLLEVQGWLWPCELVVFAALCYLFRNPRKYRAAYLASSVSLIAHVWAGPLQHVSLQL